MYGSNLDRPLPNRPLPNGPTGPRARAAVLARLLGWPTVLAWVLCVGVGAACVPAGGASLRSPVRAFRLARVVSPAGVRGQVAVTGQLLPLGTDALPYRYQGEPTLKLERRERLLLVNGAVIGVDLTGATLAEALGWLPRVRRLELLVWGDLQRIEPRLVEALSRMELHGLVLVLGESLTAAAPMDLRSLLPICDSLYGLVLHGEVTSANIKNLRRCEGLRALGLRGALPAGGLEDLGALGQLEILDLASALAAFGPGPRGLYPLVALRRLVALDLADNGLEDPEVEVLARLPALHWLRLSGNPLTGRSLAVLGGLGRLRWLDLSRTALTSAGLGRLTKLRSLLWLGISGTAVTERGVASFGRARPQVVLLAEGGVVAELDAAPALSPPATKASTPVPSPAAKISEETYSSARLRALGLVACDRYLALVRCFSSAVGSGPPGSRRAPRATVEDIQRQIRLTLPRGASAVDKACQFEMARFRRHAAFAGVARHCLRP